MGGLGDVFGFGDIFGAEADAAVGRARRRPRYDLGIRSRSRRRLGDSLQIHRRSGDTARAPVRQTARRPARVRSARAAGSCAPSRVSSGARTCGKCRGGCGHRQAVRHVPGAGRGRRTKADRAHPAGISTGSACAEGRGRGGTGGGPEANLRRRPRQDHAFFRRDETTGGSAVPFTRWRSRRHQVPP